MNKKEREILYNIDESTSEEGENMEQYIINGFTIFTIDEIDATKMHINFICVSCD